MCRLVLWRVKAEDEMSDYAYTEVCQRTSGPPPHRARLSNYWAFSGYELIPHHLMKEEGPTLADLLTSLRSVTVAPR